MNGDGMNMRQSGPGGRRPPRARHHSGGDRGANGGSGNGGRAPRNPASLRHQTFDSNGPDVRVRGNAFQVYEKYLALARDAQGAGDWVQAESLLQHAEHYYRVTEAINEAAGPEQRAPRQSFQEQQPDVPSNYYAPDGQLMEAQRAAQQGQPQSQSMSQPQPSAAPQERYQRRERPPRPPVEPSADPFFATTPKDDDVEEDRGGLQKIVAGN